MSDKLQRSCPAASIVNIDAAQRASFKALMQQQIAAFAATLPADQRTLKMAQDFGRMQAFTQSRRRASASFVDDPGAIVLRTLGNFSQIIGTLSPVVGGSLNSSIIIQRHY
jgi:hypothetical protein